MPAQRFDRDQVAAAASLTRTERGWLVLWGLHSRR
ncbi:hypothetical protein BJ981_007538 [Sphaerisporangium krabiense]|uniref:Uncharacterized protein n=1 Tax=Sphaerisporangium krabiense TaxID=763782 RepID=A0A7W8ZCZ5_9ACTN|nr:hypothetical protein [Sphaerisporangium krabiense]